MGDVSTTPTLQKPGDVSPYKRWETEINAAEKEMSKFYERANYATKKYVDERDAMYADARWFNIYYANTNILESALYSTVPKPDVRRPYEDYQDQVARVAALVLERCLDQDLQSPTDLFDAVMRQAVQDRLVAGMGTAWIRLETDTENIPESEGGTLTNDTQSTSPGAKGDMDGFTVPAAEEAPTPENPQPVGEIIPLKRITKQRVVVDYVHWKDFLFSPCRVYSERRWVARKVYMSREQLEARFGEKGKLCALDFTPVKTVGTQLMNQEGPRYEVFQKAVVYEIWDRESRKVIWFSKGYKELLDEKDDFLKLQSFEPCPEPMFANLATVSTVPRPDYYMIKDQYEELDTVNQRISKLVEACKVAGVYNQSSKEVQKLLQGAENTLIPVENWAQFTEKGGTKGAIEWLPLDQIQVTLQRLYESRDAIKGQIYELTGIADIVRGASKASETLGAQQIKAQFASVRIKKLQDEVGRFASQILRIRAEVMVKFFEPDLLIRKSGITHTPNSEYVAAAIALLKSEEGFNWRVQIQADSMAQVDYASEKQDRIEFMSAVTGYLAQSLPMAQQVPELKPVILGLLKWGMAGFKKSSDIEGMIEKQLAALEGKPPAPPPPDPKIQSEQIKQQTMQQKAQLDAQKSEQDMAIKQRESEMEIMMQQKELEFKERMAQLDMQIKQMELQFKAQEHRMSLQQKQEENAMQMQTQQVQNQLAVQDAMVQSDIKREQGEQDLELSRRQGEQQLQQSKAEGKQNLAQKKAEGDQNRQLKKAAAADAQKSGASKGGK